MTKVGKILKTRRTFISIILVSILSIITVSSQGAIATPLSVTGFEGTTADLLSLDSSQENNFPSLLEVTKTADPIETFNADTRMNLDAIMTPLSVTGFEGATADKFSLDSTSTQETSSPPSLEVKKSAESTEIFIAGSGMNSKTITTTLSPTGFEEITADILSLDSTSTQENNIPASLEITKTADPNEIFIAGSGMNPDMTTITINVTGFGGTTADTLPIDVVYAIDSSGSMTGNDPTGLRKTAAKSFTDKLNSAQDQAGVVSWDSNIDFTFGLTNVFSTLKSQIDLVDASGGTNLTVGLTSAIAMLDANTRMGSSAKVIIFLTDGQGSYIFSGNPGSPADDAASKNYVIYSIGLGTAASAPLIDMKNATGGQFFSSPSATNLQTIFNAIFTEIILSTAPSSVDVVEVTQSYIVDEASFSIMPDSIVEVGGQTKITWLNVSQYVGNNDNRLAANETFTVSFTAKSIQCGENLSVNDLEESVVNYIDLNGTAQSVTIPQAYLDVISPPEIVLSQNSSVLWPPNHKYHRFSLSDFINAVISECNPDLGVDDVAITSVSSDEPEDVRGNGDGATLDDIVIIDSHTVDLRAERQGRGDGRVYTIHFEVDDGFGSVTTSSVQVTVPHDFGPNGAAVDDGAAAGYTVYP